LATYPQESIGNLQHLDGSPGHGLRFVPIAIGMKFNNPAETEPNDQGYGILDGSVAFSVEVIALLKLLMNSTCKLFPANVHLMVSVCGLSIYLNIRSNVLSVFQ
jgi:hypothetical protein